jgi:hypothetical protein
MPMTIQTLYDQLKGLLADLGNQEKKDSGRDKEEKDK